MPLADKLKALAEAAAGIAEVATGVAPIITTVEQLGGLLHAIAGDLNTVPLDPATGKALTLDAAQAHLNLAITASQVQDDKIRAQAQKALDENAAETAGPGKV